MRDRSLWEQMKQQLESRGDDLIQSLGVHIQLVLISMLLAVIIGIAFGILISRIKALKGITLGTAGILQTIPSLAMLGFMIPLFGIGMKTAIAALFLYSLLPIIRNTYAGITEVDKSVVEAARGMGMKSGQILFKV
ncbi:ABC transporter permease, partial [Paenibacillus glucanolyticus]